VPLNRPALALSPGPRSVQDARRWVVSTYTDIGRDDLVECAEIGVSELVTNALLHGTPPLSVRVRGTREHPRIEVRDTSTDPPELPSMTKAEDEADLLLTFGRGLSIVARSAAAWGVDVDEEGKTVWLAPARVFAEGEGVQGRITGAPAERSTPARRDPRADIEVVLRDVPVDMYVAFTRHYRELRREVRLLALAHQEEYPLAKNLSDLFGSLERPLRAGLGSDQIEAALSAGDQRSTLRVPVAKGSAHALDQLIELLDLADAFCREERLLSLARSPEQRSFQNWFLGEFVRQSLGREPVPWRPSRSGIPENSLS
jgi:anti-sigma regulatory factor (Ser/Thr protein kinase)